VLTYKNLVAVICIVAILVAVSGCTSTWKTTYTDHNSPSKRLSKTIANEINNEPK
jgi:hypothetical protein